MKKVKISLPHPNHLHDYFFVIRSAGNLYFWPHCYDDEGLTAFHGKATECHLPYRITVLPTTRHRWMCSTSTSARPAGTRFIYPGGMEGWVDLGVGYITKMVYLSADSHPSKYEGRLINKLQNGAIPLILKTGKIRSIRFVENLILNTWWIFSAVMSLLWRHMLIC